MCAESAMPCALNQQRHVHGVGTAEASSNAETTMTQLVQEYTIRAQVRALCKKRGIRIDRTEHVANSLGHLAAVVDQLNSLDHPLKVPVLSCDSLARCMAGFSNKQGSWLGFDGASEHSLATHGRGLLRGDVRCLPCAGLRCSVESCMGYAVAVH